MADKREVMRERDENRAPLQPDLFAAIKGDQETVAFDLLYAAHWHAINVTDTLAYGWAA